MKNKAKVDLGLKGQKQLNNFKRRTKLLYKIITSSEIRPLPASLAYYLILAIFPLIALLGYIASLLNIEIGNILNYFNNTSIELSSFLGSIINLKTVPLNVSFYIIMALFLTSNGVYSIVIVANNLYKVNENNTLLRRIKSLIIIIILITIFIFNMLVLGFGNKILAFIINNTILADVINTIFPYFSLLKWPFSFLIIYFCIKLIYVIAPDIKVPSCSVNKGALFTTIGWIVTTFIYSYYVNNAANYNLFYGSLSGVIVLFIWTYIISYIFVVGIAINTNNYNIAKEHSIKNS